MQTSFANAFDYLSYLKQRYREQYGSSEPADAEFHRQTVEAMERIGLVLPPSTEGQLEHAILDAYRRILSSVALETRTAIEGSIAVGVVENEGANAFIARSPDGKFALLIYSGLALFLHKIFKLMAASKDPTQVTYCNRKKAETITEADIFSYIVESTTYYRDHGIPRGPMIKLSPVGMLHAAKLLISAETFVLCHELGHFLRGLYP